MRNNTVRFITRVAIFGAIAGILYTVPFLAFPLPIFPGFLKFHFDEIPLFIAGFAYGPWVALAATFVRAAIKLPFDIGETMGVGVLTDILFSLAFVLPAAFIYKYKRTFLGALVGIFVGLVCQMGIASLGNVYISIPFYIYVKGFEESQLLGAMQKANPAITDIRWSYVLFAVLPFNAIKDGIVIVITILVYKPLRKVINKINEKSAA